MEEKASLYTQDSLFERINGESELFLPYGFELLASARYVSEKNPRSAIDADIYKMGSLQDSFGIYANYRKPDSPVVKIGAEGFVSSSQLLFYQDRYFVRLQASGTLTLEQDILVACAHAISQNLPRSAEPPGELRAFMVPAVVKRSERYIAQSLLGYKFFHRGFIADALPGGEQVKVFVVLENSPDAARTAFDHYLSYLRESQGKIQIAETSGRITLSATDPLYQEVFVELTGRYLIGAVRVKETSAAKQLVEEIRKILIGDSDS